MPFVKIDAEKMVQDAIKEDPEFAELFEKAQKEFEDIKAGRLNKKYGDD